MKKRAEPADPTHRAIASRVRELRKARLWTQAELSARLGLSQNRLSEIERGDGSFTAEQFLMVLKLFNAPLSDFGIETQDDETTMLQNALARLGAVHLQESERVLPSERFRRATDAIREALLSRAPRLITAIAPVLVCHADDVNLHGIDDRLTEIGLATRVPWLVENMLEALKAELRGAVSRPWAQRYRRSALLLDAFHEKTRSRVADVTDVLDGNIRTKKTIDEVSASWSSISRRWQVVTELQPTDFAAALEAARVDR